MLRILHTADWHLGATTEGVSRDEDHARFLDWLAASLEEHRPDALIVAGDVFDQGQPPAEAQRLYYRFLHDVARRRVRKVVVVGGNHDSPSRLDAPREILETLDVHVVGGLQADEASWERCLCPIAGAGGGVEAVILAVPFVHEFRLGVRTSLQEPAEIARSFRERFSALYRRLCDLAAERFPGVPLVATGHLTCAGAERADAPADIHMVGTIGGLPADIFDPRIRYVALGHIHAAHRVGGSRAWYAGSPVALSAREARTPRRVLLADIDPSGGEPRVEPLAVPEVRAIVEVRGPIEAVAARLRDLSWTTPLPPLVYAAVRVERYTASVEGELFRALAARGGPAPRLVEVRQELDRTDGARPEAAPAPTLRDLGPEEVFRRLCEARGTPCDEALLGAFLSLLGAGAAEVERAAAVAAEARRPRAADRAGAAP
jgi:exonuclease SbcD